MKAGGYIVLYLEASELKGNSKNPFCVDVFM